jgi:alpha-galactosidase
LKTSKIAVVGIGSASFGPMTLGDILSRPELSGSSLCLMDINADAAESMGRLARRLNESWDAGLQIETTTDLAMALPDADFVICMLEASRDRLWQFDMQIPVKYGVKQVLGENGGPGGLAHTLRTAPLVLEVARQMEIHCPSAWLLNYTNPLPRNCRAVEKYSDIKVIGFCHGIGNTVDKIAKILELDADDIDVKAAGLNHFHWVLDVRSSSTGEDLYPLLRQRELEFEPRTRRLWSDLFRRFDYIPFPSDDHIGEYLPFFHVEAFDSWTKYNHEPHRLLYGEVNDDRRQQMWLEIEEMSGGIRSAEHLRAGSGERAVPVMIALKNNGNSHELALNLPNKGYINNLPQDCIVEVPASVSGFGAHGLSVGDLPAPIAAWCSNQVYVAELAVDAAVQGDRTMALQALLADPVINDIDVAEKILDEFLSVHADWLPKFT